MRMSRYKSEDPNDLIFAATENKRCHHFLGSRHPLLGKQADFGIPFDLEDCPEILETFGELIRKDEVHQRLSKL
jgi:hypothetical protein